MPLTELEIESIAKALIKAEEERNPIDPITDGHPYITIEDAYKIQKKVVEIKLFTKKGLRIVGKKIGLTSKAMQKMFGIDQPDYGHLFNYMYVEDGSTISLSELIQPRIEAEIAFVLKEDLEGPGVTVADVLRAAEGVMPALEIIDSRIKNWKIKIQDTIADNASSGKFVLGGVLVPVKDLDLRLIGVVLEVNGEVVATATGAAVLGNPATAVAWLANKLAEYGEKLRKGEIILSGSFVAAVPVEKGMFVKATFSRLGAVSIKFI
jgi:2-keto-4-pentenoate hydratase